MFMAELLTALQRGLQLTFDDTYEVEDFRDLHISLDFPIDSKDYPGIWIGFDTTTDLARAGIDHREFIVQEIDGETRFGEVTRWRFEGRVTFTVASTSSLSRARLVDEMIKVLGFGNVDEDRNVFHRWLADNPLIATILNSDTISLQGLTESTPTPWGSDEMIYEATVASMLVGEFTSTPRGLLVPLSEVVLYPYVEGTPDPVPDGAWE
jgi:hypothetical protein